MTARILIVEDHPASLELLQYLLQAAGYETLQATDGGEAIDLALAERPDLVICDMQLPEVSGYEVAKRLKGDPELRKVPLIAVTAFSMVGDRDKVLAAGFDGYFSKPIEPELFIAQMENFLPPALRRGR